MRAVQSFRRLSELNLLSTFERTEAFAEKHLVERPSENKQLPLAARCCEHG